MKYMKRTGTSLGIVLLVAAVVLLFAFGFLARNAMMENSRQAAPNMDAANAADNAATGDMVTIVDEPTPQAMLPANTWSTMSMMLTLVGLALAAATARAIFTHPNMTPYKVISALAGVLMVVLFFATNPMSGKPALVNGSTLPFAFILLVQMVMVLMSLRPQERDAEAYR